MKKNLLFIISCAVLSNLDAQPNITNYNWVNGIHRYFYTENAVEPNPVAPGNNVTWDFTSLTSDPADSSTFQISGGTPFSNDFPNANVVWSEYKAATNQNVLWHFYKDQFSFEFLGFGEVGVGTNIYSSQKKMLKFPLVFNTTFTDYYTAGSSYKSDVKYDGYGTLKLPGAIYTNVFRTSSKDSVSPNDITYYYEWFDANRRIMFMKKRSSFSYTYYLKTSNTVSIENNLTDAEINVFPNPSKGQYNIDLPNEMENVEINIYDFTGKVIESLQTDGTKEINLELVKPGYYIIAIAIRDQIFYKKLLVLN